ncbi:YciI family protein [Agaribacter flavus]|uniref:YciI family protein n=1 Tax=Agaribacter flavus TaxID=1902781 RepID=A0ABV7FRH9_9ALTE
MQDYMLVYKGGDPDWHINTPPEEMQAIMGEWEKWMVALSEKGKLVSGGNPLHYSGKRIENTDVVTDIAVSEYKELVSGYSIIKAESLDEATELAKSCPVLFSPDCSVEVREIMCME